MNFTTVDTAPQELKDTEHVIIMPNFLEEIRDSKLRVGEEGTAPKLTRNNMIRNTLVLIGMRYMPESFNAFSIPLGNYEGLEYTTEGDISNILVDIITKHSPGLIDAAILKKIQSRPKKVNMLFFVGDKSKEILFIENGMSFVPSEQFASLLAKPKLEVEAIELEKESQVKNVVEV